MCQIEKIDNYDDINLVLADERLSKTDYPYQVIGTFRGEKETRLTVIPCKDAILKHERCIPQGENAMPFLICNRKKEEAVNELQNNLDQTAE